MLGESSKVSLLCSSLNALVSEPGDLDSIKPFATEFHNCPFFLQAALRHSSILPTSARLCAKLWISKEAFLDWIDNKIAPWCLEKDVSAWSIRLQRLFERVVPHHRWIQRELKDVEMKIAPTENVIQLALKHPKHWTKWSSGKCAECEEICSELASDGCYYCDRCWVAWTTNDESMKATICAEKAAKTKAVQATHEQSSSCAASSTTNTRGDATSHQKYDDADGWEMHWDQNYNRCYWIADDGHKTYQDPRKGKRTLLKSFVTSDTLNAAAQRGAGAKRIAESSMKILAAPLTYEVITNILEIHVNPSPDAPVVETLSLGHNVQGFPAGAWVRLVSEDDNIDVKQSPPRWALLVKGNDQHFQLAPSWGRVQAVQATRDCENHLHITWPGLPLPAGDVTYRIRWRAMDESSGIYDVGFLNFDRLPLPKQVTVLVEAIVLAATQQLRMVAAWSEKL